MQRVFFAVLLCVVTLVSGARSLPTLAQTPPATPQSGSPAAGHVHIIGPNASPSAQASPNNGSYYYNLGYNGGQVMHSTTSYAIFRLPTGFHYEASASSAGDTSYESLIERYLGDVGGSSLYNIVTQYPDSVNGYPLNSSTFGGAYVDTTPYPHRGSYAGPLLDSDIQQEIQNAVAANTSHGWAAGPTSQF